MTSSIFTRLHGVFSKSPKPVSAVSSTGATTSSTTSSAPPNPLPPEIQEAVLKFKYNSRFQKFRRNQDFYEAVSRRFSAGKHFSAIEDIFEYQKKYKDSMADEIFVAKLIKLYGKAGMFDHAYKLFDELPQFNCPRTVISLNALLFACVKSKKFDEVTKFFRDLPGELGIEPHVASYNMVIKAFCESKDFDSAMKVIEKMEDSAILPDSVSYNTVMEAYYREDNLEEAEKLWQRMRERGVMADVNTYNAKIRNMVRNDQVQEALDLVDKMLKEEVKPDKFTYNAVIRGCVDSGNLEQAKMVFRMMAGVCSPDQLTYNMLIPFACEKGDIDFALELSKQTVKLRVYVHRSLMQLVIDALVIRSKVEEAIELVSLAKSSKKHRYTLTLPTSSFLY